MKNLQAVGYNGACPVYKYEKITIERSKKNAPYILLGGFESFEMHEH